MYAVIFEVQPRPALWDDYVGTAAELRPELERIEGFIENRRFRSRTRPGVVLSLSFWEGPEAVIRWRSHAGHRLAQLKGRAAIFQDYRLRVGEVIAQQRVGDTTATASAGSRTVMLLHGPKNEQMPAGWGEWDLFDGLLDPSDRIMLLAGPTLQRQMPAADQRQVVRIAREYGMRDRTEAPQVLPEASP